MLVSRFAIKKGIAWLALVGLTLVGFAVSESRGEGVAYLALGAGVVKFFVIFLDFMEMKHAHPLWRVAMGTFVLTLFAAIGLILSGAVDSTAGSTRIHPPQRCDPGCRAVPGRSPMRSRSA